MKPSALPKNNLLKSRAHMTHSFDKHTTLIPINVGDHVMLWTPYKKQNLSRGFQPNWSGPWIVQQYTGPTNCKLINDKGHTKNVHVNQLKRIEERHIHPSDSNYKKTTHHVNDNVSQPQSSCTEIFKLFDENDIETLRNVTPEQTDCNIINRTLHKTIFCRLEQGVGNKRRGSGIVLRTSLYGPSGREIVS